MDVASLFLQLEWRRKREGCETRPGTRRAAGRARRGAPRASAHPLPRSAPQGSPERSSLGTALVGQRRDPDRRQVLPRLTAGSCQSCAGCSVRAACARTAWLGLPQHRPGRGTKLDVATLDDGCPPQSSTRTRAGCSRRLLWAVSGRGTRGRGYYRPAPTASAAGGRRWTAPGCACAFPGASSWPLTLGTQPLSLRPTCLSLLRRAQSRSSKPQGGCQWPGVPEDLLNVVFVSPCTEY